MRWAIVAALLVLAACGTDRDHAERRCTEKGFKSDPQRYENCLRE